jgi:hypothetical protein
VTVRNLFGLLPAGLLGLGTALLVSCGSSGAGLIPEGNAGPLEADFQEVARAAQEGNGDCTATEAAIRKTESDFRALPATVDAGLHGRLEEGITHLGARARTLCAQPLARTTTTTGQTTTTTRTTPTTGTTQTTPTTGTSTAPATSTGPTPTTSVPSGPGGGTPAPGAGGNESQPGTGGAGNGQGGSGAPGASEGGQAGGAGTGGAGGSASPNGNGQ